MTKEKKFAGLFEFVLSYLEMLVASRPVEKNPEVAGPEGII